MSFTHPILTCKASEKYEGELLVGDETREWEAMSKAGRALGDSVLRDFQEIASLPESIRVLVLAGKGHNAGDALIASEEILCQYPEARISILFVFGDSNLKTLTQRSLDNLLKAGGDQVTCETWNDDRPAHNESLSFDICLDGLLGMQFKPPLRSPAENAIQWINNHSHIRLRAAVDLPSGLGDERADFVFRADCQLRYGNRQITTI